jgi:hypothetical protein
MKRFVEGTDRGEATLFPEYLEDWINEDNPVRAIDAFVDKLSLAELGFAGMAPEATGPVRLALQLPFPKVSESMGNHDSKIVDAGGVD